MSLVCSGCFQVHIYFVLKYYSAERSQLITDMLLKDVSEHRYSCFISTIIACLLFIINIIKFVTFLAQIINCFLFKCIEG